MHADAGVTNVYMHVVPSPDVGNDDASGTVIRNHFFMELVPPPGSDSAASRRAAKMVVGVAVHELAHALYDSAPVTVHLALMRQFVVASDHGGPSMYAFVNEAIATAVSGMVADLASEDDSDDGGEDRHPYIPRLGRAATEPLRMALATSKTMNDGFVDDYVRPRERCWARMRTRSPSDSPPWPL